MGRGLEVREKGVREDEEFARTDRAAPPVPTSRLRVCGAPVNL